MHKGVGGLDRRYDLLRTLAVIRHYRPDVVLLQEAAQGIPRLRREDQVATLAGELGFFAAFSPEHQFRVGGYGNLVLSRWPITSASHLDLTVGWRKRRGMLQAHLRVPWGQHQRTLVVHNLHLGLSGAERVRQLDRCLSSQLLSGLHQGTCAILGGDLNDLWGSLGPKQLIPWGFQRAGTPMNTFPSALPLRPLDGLFYRGELTLTHCAVGRSRVARSASDHLPIYADFVLP